MTAKEQGYRRLGINDIIRAGDFEWTNTKRKMFAPACPVSSYFFGKQVCLEEIQLHGNDFYRKLRSTNATK